MSSRNHVAIHITSKFIFHEWRKQIQVDYILSCEKVLLNTINPSSSYHIRGSSGGSILQNFCDCFCVTSWVQMRCMVLSLGECQWSAGSIY